MGAELIGRGTHIEVVYRNGQGETHRGVWRTTEPPTRIMADPDGARRAAELMFRARGLEIVSLQLVHEAWSSAEVHGEESGEDPFPPTRL